MVGLQAGQATAEIRKLIGKEQGRHQEESGLAQLTDILRDLPDLGIEQSGQFGEVGFLAILAADGVGTTVYAEGHLSHGSTLQFGRQAAAGRVEELALTDGPASRQFLLEKGQGPIQPPGGLV